MTTTTPRPNRDALNKAIDVYRDAMRPFIVRTLKANVKGATVEETIRQSLNERARAQFDANLKRAPGNPAAALDVNDFPHIAQRNRAAFSAYGNVLSSEMWLAVEARNPAAHPPDRDMDAESVRASLTIIAGALGRTNHAAQKAEVEAIRDALTAAPPEQPAPPEPQPAPAVSGKPAPKTRGASANLKAWREAIQPRADVSQGAFHQAEFAADLQQVHDGRAANEYGNPVTFFAQTYLTSGLRMLLVNAARRLGGKGGDPVIQTKTGFGGGKTHSLIALHHLAKSAAALVNSADPKDGERVGREARSILSDAGLDPDDPPDAKVAVLDGAHLAATDATLTPAGDPLNTLWGVMAHQLGGQDGYEIVGAAARQGSAPGGAQLTQLLESVGPCVILMDELVVYARRLDEAGKGNLYSFLQALTQAVKGSRNAALVVTLLESETQAGGEAGMEALRQLEGILGRIETVWEPLRVDEAFEVVRRRLFGDDIDIAERDRTCAAFAHMYQRSRGDYPQPLSEGRYAERLKQCYPIHPEIFDRLYEDWSALPDFQRTRGVLRLMATAVSRLYRRNDASPLLMPANLPLDDAEFSGEFVKLLAPNWRPVLSEADSDGSRTDVIDSGSERFSKIGAARRIARAVFLGSAPGRAQRGLEERQTHAAVMQPGHNVADYNDALRKMENDLYYLYHADGRYYFHVEQNLNKVASDRARDIEQRDIDAHVVGSLLREAAGRRRDVVIAPADSADVPESDEVRLVILPPDKHLPSRSAEADAAGPYALDILLHRGDPWRVARNTLIFLAAKADEIRALRESVRKYLAWFSIVNGGDHGPKVPEVTGERAAQAAQSIRAAESEMHTAFVNAYRWTLAPAQPDPQKSEYDFHIAQTARSGGGDVVQAAFDACLQEEQLADKIAPSQLANLLEQWVWSKEAADERVSVEALWAMLANNVYMPRLRNKTVLQQCVFDGAEQGAFGYADAYRDGEYANLRYRQAPRSPSAVGESGDSVLVRPDKAREIAEAPAPGGGPAVGATPWPTDPGAGGVTPWPDDPAGGGTTQPPPGPVRLTVRKRVSGEISLDDLGQLRDEIIANLLRDGGEVTIEITGRKPGGFSENAARPVRENSKQLSLEFDEGHDA